MQARVSQSKMESQEIAGQVSNAHSREYLLLAASEYPSSPSSHLVEPALVPQSSAQSTQQLSEVLLWRKIAQVVVTHSQPEVALYEIAAILGTVFEAEACSISICTHQLTQRQTVHWIPEQLRTPFRQAEVAAAHLAIETETLKAGSVLSISSPQRLSDTDCTLPINSVMSAETRFQGQVNGVISLMQSHSSIWTDSEIAALNTVSDQVAIAISQVLLQQQVLKQAQYQSLLRQLTMSTQNSMDLRQILKLAIDGTAQALRVQRGFVLRLKYWDPRHSLRSTDRIPRARVIVECEWREEAAQLTAEGDANQAEMALNQSFWVSDCILCQQAISADSEPLAFTDRDDFPQQTESVKIASIFEPAEMPALLLVPLESKNKLLGFIALQQSQSRHWQPDEIELAELVGAQISSAIIQTETLRQVESLVEERTAQLQQSLELQAKLYEITRKQIEKLRKMNQRMDEFLSTLSHELRTPLTSMMLAIRMLREADLSPDRRLQYLNILEQQCAQETSLINDLLALQELETKQVLIQLQKVDLKQVISDLSQSFYQRWTLKGLNLEVDLPAEAPFFSTDKVSLSRILLELLTNAGKYSDPNSTVSLKVAQQTGQQIALTLCNIGPGISEEELPHIFDKFRRCQGMTQNAVPGTGLGLALVKSLVQHLNGTVTATSVLIEETQSYKTCFTVTLPQNLEFAK